ncbi:MAG: hypothetical protein P8P17_17595 [Pseudomonadales bacterium]|nr:hypothetical protein [Pseudomonadales bacterium]
MQSLKRHGRLEQDSDYPATLQVPDHDEFGKFCQAYIEDTAVHR